MADNPYDGDIKKGIEYDAYEARSFVIEDNRGWSQPLTFYRAAARRLVRNLPEHVEHVLDLGAGTGIATLEALVLHPSARVSGIELSPGMIDVAKYKFNQSDGAMGIMQIDDKILRDYWQRFRAESEPFKHQATFVQGDFQTTNALAPESIDGAIANQFMHWTDMRMTFRQLGRFLKQGAPVIWNSSSHRYDDSDFPTAQYGFKYNDFLKAVVDELGKKVAMKDYREQWRPTNTLESYKDITETAGFVTNKVGLFLLPVDLQVFARHHVPRFAKELITTPLDDGEKERLVKNAIALAITNPAALSDVMHKYEIIPILESTKR